MVSVDVDMTDEPVVIANDVVDSSAPMEGKMLYRCAIGGLCCIGGHLFPVITFKQITYSSAVTVVSEPKPSGPQKGEYTVRPWLAWASALYFAPIVCAHYYRLCESENGFAPTLQWTIKNFSDLDQRENSPLFELGGYYWYAV